MSMRRTHPKLCTPVYVLYTDLYLLICISFEPHSPSPVSLHFNFWVKGLVHFVLDGS